jgi:hypothetical protein
MATQMIGRFIAAIIVRRSTIQNLSIKVVRGSTAGTFVEQQRRREHTKGLVASRTT